MEYKKPAVINETGCKVPKVEIYNKGHLACPGCGVAICARLAMKVLGRKTILVVPACCFAVIDGPFPFSAAGVPLLHCAFESAGATASGVRAGLAQRGINDTTVVAWAGDGGTYDIGLQALSAAAERNEDMIFVCYDNEAYMNTGIQRSSATPSLAWTTTTPAYPGKSGRKKDIAEIIAAHKVPYFATASVSYLDDYLRKFAIAKSMKGFRFLHLYSPCTAGWKYPESDTVELGFLAVKTRVFPLLEAFDGERWKLNENPVPLPVSQYLSRQGRFKHLTGQDVAVIQKEVDERWQRLIGKCELPARPPDYARSIPAARAGGGELSEKEFARLLGAHLVDAAEADVEKLHEMYMARARDPNFSGMSQDELISHVITVFQMMG